MNEYSIMNVTFVTFKVTDKYDSMSLFDAIDRNLKLNVIETADLFIYLFIYFRF
jgi:hypothetical protein